MKALYFDGEAGAAGDMILGALIHLGVDPSFLGSALTPITPVPFSLRSERVSVSGIAATRAVVEVAEEKKYRHLSEIEDCLERGDLPALVRERARRIFHRLADAEARIHNSTREKVHFHEVGATDAIVDIVGTVYGLELLGAEQVCAAPLVLGSGVGVSAHGSIIYPAPAVLEILRGIPVRYESGLGETATPTGAAILAEIAEFVDDLSFTPEAIGYGAGTRQFADRPNLIRATLGQVHEAFEHDSLWLATSDIDNTRPEVFAWVAELLYQSGAVDVTLTDVSMKKGRRGTRVEFLCDQTQRNALAEIVLTETGSLGVRWQRVSRTKLPRRIDTFDTPWGPIRVKVAITPRGERGIPEYEDCRSAAKTSGVPLMQIFDTVSRLFAEHNQS